MAFVNKVKVNCIILLFSVNRIRLAVNQCDCYNYHHYSMWDTQVNNGVINYRLNFRFDDAINNRENRRHIKNGQFRDTGNIGHTRQRTKTNNTQTQHNTEN